MRSDDIAPLLVPPGQPEIGFRQGTILTWDGASGANTVQIGTEVFEDLQTVSANGNVMLLAGDVVGILRINNRYVILGRIATNDHQRMNFLAAGFMSPNDGHTEALPGTTSSTDDDLWNGWVARGSDRLWLYSRTNVPASTTAVFTVWINGTKVADSGTYSFGRGEFQAVVDWPADTAYNSAYPVAYRARRTSGTGTVYASVQGLYEV